MTQEENIKTAEYALAGSILVDSRCLAAIPTGLQGAHFANLYPRIVYNAARDLAAQGISPDVVTISQWAQAHDCALPQSVMLEMGQTTPSATNAGHYAQIVLENGLRNKVLDIARQMQNSPAKPLNQLICDSVAALSTITAGSHSGLIRASEVSYEPPKWLIAPYFQRGKGTLIQADPGTGKTAFLCAIAAAVTTGRGFLGLEVETPGNVLMISTEDDPGVLRGRIEACGGNLDRVLFLRETAGLTFQSPEIASAMEQIKPKLVIFDPFQSFLGAKVDLFRANETRPILARLFEMCAKYDCACAIIAHLGKQTAGKNAVNQSLGSVDIPGIMRSILHITRNPSSEDERVAVHIKSSNAAHGKSISFTIGDRGGVRFTGLSDLTLKDLAAAKEEQPDTFIREDMVQVLQELCKQERRSDFFSYDEIRSAAMQQLGYQPYQDSRELLHMLRQPEFLKHLQEKEGIELKCPVKRGGARGIQLRLVKKGTLGTEKAEKAVVAMPDNRPRFPWDDSLPDIPLPWEETA